MAAVLLVANLIHGLIGLVWIGGLARVARPLPAALWMHLLAFALLVPPAIGAMRLLGGPTPGGAWTLVRVDLWTAWALSSPLVLVLAAVLLGGTLVIFLVQEVRPLLAERSARHRGVRRRDAALSGALERVAARYRDAGIVMPRGRTPRAVLLEDDALMAALEGVVQPVLLVSRGLIATLDHHELEAVLAHELAHHVQGGNRRLLVAWVMRAIQAVSPPALILFRTLIEAREVAADALAASVTAKPAVLGAALLKLHGHPGPPPRGMGALARARHEVLRKAEVSSIRLRVEALLHPDARPTSPVSVSLLATLALVALLWGIH